MTVSQEELETLKNQVAEMSLSICEQLPTLLAVLDFRKTTDIELTRSRTKEGWYGFYCDGEFIAPRVGEYVGIFSDMNAKKMKDLKEAIFGSE